MGARKLLILLATVATVAGGLVIGRAISKSGPSSSPPMIQGSATLDTLPRRIIDPTPAHDAARWMTSLTHDEHPSVVVFWDFTCPISREYFLEVVPNLADVSIGFAHLPLLGPGAGLDLAPFLESTSSRLFQTLRMCRSDLPTSRCSVQARGSTPLSQRSVLGCSDVSGNSLGLRSSISLSLRNWNGLRWRSGQASPTWRSSLHV